MKCDRCGKKLTLGHLTLAHFYPKFFPNPPPIVRGDKHWVVWNKDGDWVYCSKKCAKADGWRL